MSFLVAGMVFRARVATGDKVASTDKLVLLALADIADDEGRCWPKLATIASKCECSDDTVKRSVIRLTEAGLLGVTPRHDDSGRQISNIYTINVDLLRERTPKKEGGHHAPPPPASCTPTTRIMHPHEGGHHAPPYNLSEEPIKEPSPPTPRRKSGAHPVEKLPTPDWLPADAWEMWVRHRSVTKRAPLTPDAWNLSLRNLEKFRSQGMDPREVIEQSVQSGWTGLFPLKTALHERGRYHNGGGLASRRQEKYDEISSRPDSGCRQSDPSARQSDPIDGVAVQLD